MPVDQTTRVDAWLYGLLSSDTTLNSLAPGGVHNDVMDQDTNIYPAVVFLFMGSSDVRPAGKQFVMEDCRYTVKAIGKGASYAALQTTVDRFTALLDNQAGSVFGGQVLYCQRLGIIRYPEIDEGVQYRHLGAIFRILAQ